MKYISTINKACTGAVLPALFLLLLAFPAAASGRGETPDLARLVEEGKGEYLLVDVRTPAEFAGGYIPTAVNIPLSDLPGAMPDVDKDSRVILYCRSGNRSAQAASILRSAGFTSVTDFGGINRWEGELVRP